MAIYVCNISNAKIIKIKVAVAYHTAMPYTFDMHTVIETEVFIRAASEIWTDAERMAFINWLAANPEAGDVIPGFRWMP